MATTVLPWHLQSQGWLLEEPSPAEVRVTLDGSARAFKDADPEDLAVELDVGSVQPGGQELSIDRGALKLPPDVGVQRLEPRTTMVVAHRTVEIQLPIKAQISGRIAPGMILSEITTSPERASVVVRASDRARYVSLKTEPIDLSTLDRTTTVTRRAILPEGVHTPEGAPLMVDVTARITRPMRSESPRAPASATP